MSWKRTSAPPRASQRRHSVSRKLVNVLPSTRNSWQLPAVIPLNGMGPNGVGGSWKPLRRSGAGWIARVVPLTRRAFRRVALFAGFCLPMSSWALSGRGDVEIKLLATGQPCFSLSAKDQKRDPNARLGALAVTDLSLQSPKEVWRMTYPPMQGAPVSTLSTVGCIVYGVPAESATAAPAGELQDGRPYSVSIRVRPSDPNDPIFGYSTTFCVLGQGAERRIALIGSADKFRSTGRCD